MITPLAYQAPDLAEALIPVNNPYHGKEHYDHTIGLLGPRPGRGPNPC